MEPVLQTFKNGQRRSIEGLKAGIESLDVAVRYSFRPATDASPGTSRRHVRFSVSSDCTTASIRRFVSPFHERPSGFQGPDQLLLTPARVFFDAPAQPGHISPMQ